MTAKKTSKKNMAKGSVKNNKKRLLIITLVVLLSIPLTLYLLVRGIVFLFPRAQAVPATISLNSSTAVVPPNATVTVKVNAAANIGFVRASILFNKSKMQLTGEVVPGTALKTIVSQTTMAEANATGKITLVYALATGDKANPPSGTFNLGTFSVKTLSTTTNDPTVFSIDQADSQVADLNVLSLPISSQNLNLTLNAVATAQPTATAAPTATPLPTLSGTRAPEKTIVPSFSPAPTVTVKPVTPAPTASQAPTATAAPTTSPVGQTKQVVWTLESLDSAANQDGNTVSIAEADADGLWIGTGANTANSFMGLRFTGATLPSDAKITNVMIGVSATREQWLPVGVKFFTQDALVTEKFVTGGLLSSRTRLSANATYNDNVKWLANTMYYYDVTSPVNAVFSKYANQNKSLVILGQGMTQYGRKFINATGAYSPRLSITYTTALQTPAPQIPSGYGDFIDSLIRFLVSLGFKISR